MRILYLTARDGEEHAEERRLLESMGHETEALRCALLSALTSMTLTSKARKWQPDVVMVSRTSDAAAAMSARVLYPELTFKIVMRASACQDAPRGLAADVASAIDGWIMPSQRLAKAYILDAAALRPTEQEWEKTVFFSGREQSGDIKVSDTNTPCTLLWFGPIDGNTERLRAAIDAVDEAPVAHKLKILGQGKAQNVMPAVKASRAMMHPQRVEWLGPEFTLDDQLDQAGGIVQSGSDALPEEMEAACGRHLLLPSLETSPFAAETRAERAQRLAVWLANLAN